MKLNLSYVGIIVATMFMVLSGPASFATPTNQTQLTDTTDQEETSPEEFAFVSIGEGSNATVQYYTYTPQTLEINAGETVTWFSPDEFVDIHTVTFVRDQSIQSDILLPFAIPAGSSVTNFELLRPFTLGEPVIIPGPEGREAIVAMNKVAWYPTVVGANNQTTYLEGTDIQATLNSTVKVLNSGIILPSIPSMEEGQMNNTEASTAAVEPSTTPEISPTSLTTGTTNNTDTPTDVLTIPDDQGIPQDQEGATEEPLGPPFPPVSSFTVAFEEPGVYPYFCAIHPWMTGQVIVREDGPTDTGTQQSPSNDTAITTTPTTPDATTLETQDAPPSDPDANGPTPTQPSEGAESPNPIFG
jgi:plastocyanin